MKRFSEKKILATGFVLAIAILITIGITMYNDELSHIESVKTMTETSEMLHELEETHSLSHDAEVGVRGYIKTGEEHYLTLYKSAKRAINLKIQHLRKFIADNRRYQEQWNAVELLLAKKSALMEEKIVLRKNKGFNAIWNLTLTDTEEQLHFDIHKIISDIDEKEQGILKSHEEHAEVHSQKTLRVLVIGNGISLMLLFLVFYFLNLENTKRKKAEEILSITNNELEMRVQERTAELTESNATLRRQRNELDVRARILSAVIEIKDLDTWFTIVLNEIIEFLDVEFCSIHLVRGGELILSYWHGISDEFRANVLSFKIDSVPDIMREAHVLNERLSEQQIIPEYARHDGIQTWASIQLDLPSDMKDKPGEWLGSIIVCSRRYEALSEENVKAMAVIADQIALAIDRARSYRQAAERFNRLQVLREIDKAIIQHNDLREVMHVVLERVPKSLGADAVAISLFDEMNAQMRVSSFRRPNGTIIDEEAFSIADSLLHWFVDKREVVVIYDLTQDPRVQMNREYIRNGKLVSYLGVPLIVQDKTIGILHIMTTQPKIFEEEDVEFFRTMAGQTAIAIKNAQSAANLRESEKKYRTLFEESKDVVFISTPEGRLLDINPAGIELFGYSSKEEMLRIDIARDLYSNPEVRKEFVQLMEQHGFAKDFELAMKKKDGQKVIALITATTVRDEKGDIVAYRGIMRDETERRMAEELTKNILKSVGEGLIVIDHENRILSANRAFCEQVKMPIEDIVGSYCYKIARHYDRPCYDKGEECPVKHTFETGGTHSVQHIHMDKEGNFLNVEAKSYPIKNAEGKIVSVIEIITDITDRKKLEDQLIHAQKMEAVGQLAGGIAHDFNNILTAIIGYGHITLTKMLENDPLRLNIEHLLEAADRAAQLTQSLLTFGRKQVINKKPVDLNEIIRKGEKFLTRVVSENIEVKTALHESALNILADSGQIEQVLINLLTNARDAMPYGGSFTIETALTELDNEFITAGYGKQGNYAVILATDTGKGMDEKTKKHIFEPFFTTKEIGKGTGLGMAIVYGIIKEHNGFINVYSEPGKGTTFKIYLPVITSEAAVVEKASEKEYPQRGTETILLAEDDESVRKLTTHVMRELGYEVIEAVDGEDAVKKFIENKDKIQLLLFDLIMPKMTGKDAYDEIKKIAPDIKIIFSSGYATDILRNKDLWEDGMSIIYKPISPIDLLRKVKSVLNEKKT